MIIYGSKTKQLAKQFISGKCANCGTENSIEMYVFQKYAHVFWIPFFPIGKTTVSQCEHCKQVLKTNEMPSSLVAEYETIKSQTKTPVWTFSGLLVLVILVAAGVLSDRENDKKNVRLILAPQIGDVLEIKTADNQYTLYRVENSEGDSAYMRVNQFETNKLSGLSDIKRKGDGAYSQEVHSVSKAELKTMLDNGEIVNIERK